MSTSEADPGSVLLLALVAALAVLLAQRRCAPPGRLVWWPPPGRLLWPPPVTALVLWLVVAVPSLLRLAVPSLLGTFGRDPLRIRAEDEWWRVLTSVLVQDGGVFVTLVNLLLLAVVATVAVRVWGPGRAVGLFAVSQLLFGLFTAFVSPSTGAGSSGASFAVAGSIAGLWLAVGARGAVLAAAVGIGLAGAVLVVAGDGHGVAVLVGVLLGAVLGTVAPPRRAALAAAVRS
ncbi:MULTISPECIES: rhomboid family intramembrane serine protease [Rhodococcus]|uniref:rhomboid family intramembrane serine protease n=1 Tax=Rhodococcus TaxID=1827 RepID=UPI00143E855D|nr:MULTISPECIES: rhomboid family intramembrane serine protease [Rhodococcus]QIX49688.1 rhomboid family intramembrane serine protease [Rhodococcus sp. DMU1]QRI75266.1 rhomboid family intramembrane serine protease [Rhodococcus aetherivorans]QSE58676.1 rhomboid family intramembrane serine protease [Rhodococcus sp. PSBB066]QSE70002.1 rhomboid family intramembrane serine protease [Rhodococcus sp. PSBB049]